MVKQGKFDTIVEGKNFKPVKKVKIKTKLWSNTLTKHGVWIYQVRLKMDGKMKVGSGVFYL